MKIGTFTVGGGQAMLPFIQRAVVDERRWATEEEMTDIVTIATALPGVLAINTATAVGGKVGGKAGAVCATAGVVCPSLAVMAVIAAFYRQAAQNDFARRAFMGARPAVAGLMAAAVWRVAKTACKAKWAAALAAVVCGLTIWGAPAQWTLPAVAIGALVAYMARARLKR